MAFDPNEVTPCGKTNAQINAEQVDYVQSAIDALSSMRHLDARWWYYSVSHNTFEMVIGDALGKGNLVLEFVGCKWISGPVSWPNQQLILHWNYNREQPDKAWEYILEDKSVGFRIEANMFIWKRDYNLLRYGSIYNPRSDA